MLHEHAHTWCILKTLYSGSGGTGTSSTSLVPSHKSVTRTGSTGSGGGLSTTIANSETPTGEIITGLMTSSPVCGGEVRIN